MTIETFTKTLLPLFPQSANELSPETEFKKCPEWNSMLAFLMIACIEEEFGVLLKSKDLLTTTTVRDIFNIAVTTKN